MSKDDLKCPLADCGEKTKNGTGYAAHCRAHVIRGEAVFGGDDGKTLIRVPEVPIVTEPYARKLRMDAIKAGTIKAQIHLPSKSEQKSKVAAPDTRLAKRGPYKKRNGHQIDIPATTAPFDISKLSPEQQDALRQQLGMPQAQGVMVEDHSCPSTRATDRLKHALVLTSVAEMLDDVPADQLLMMLSASRAMPPMSRRRNG